MRTEILENGIAVYTERGFGEDALLLAGFAAPRVKGDICELGTGCGAVLLKLFDRGFSGFALGVDIDGEELGCFSRAIEDNSLTGRAEAVLCDFRLFRRSPQFDCIISNPPYFKNLKTGRDAAARHETNCTLDELISAAQRLIKDRGRFFMCYKPERLPELFTQLCAHDFAPKRLCSVRNTRQNEAWLVLVEAVKFGGEGLSILPDIISKGE